MNCQIQLGMIHASVLTGQQEGQLSANRKPGQHLTHNCEACTQDKMLTNFQGWKRGPPGPEALYQQNNQSNRSLQKSDA